MNNNQNSTDFYNASSAPNPNKYSILAIKQKFIPILTKNVSKATLELAIILEHIADIPREKYIANEHISISEEQYILLEDMIIKRSQNTPLAYLTGYKEFYGKDYIVNPNVLIPRPETELLVETTITLIQEINSNIDGVLSCIPCNILDCGTGSGCIAISIYSYIHEHVDTLKKSWSVSISDISLESLKVAKENISNLIPQEHIMNNNINIYQGNLLDITPLETPHTEHFPIGIILANLPYVSHAHLQMSNIEKEPLLALTGSSENVAGTMYIENLFSQASQTLKTPHILVLEADPLQFDTLSYLAAKHRYTIQHSILDIRSFPRIFYCMKM